VEGGHADSLGIVLVAHGVPPVLAPFKQLVVELFRLFGLAQDLCERGVGVG